MDAPCGYANGTRHMRHTFPARPTASRDHSSRSFRGQRNCETAFSLPLLDAKYPLLLFPSGYGWHLWYVTEEDFPGRSLKFGCKATGRLCPEYRPRRPLTALKVA